MTEQGFSRAMALLFENYGLDRMNILTSTPAAESEQRAFRLMVLDRRFRRDSRRLERLGAKSMSDSQMQRITIAAACHIRESFP